MIPFVQFHRPNGRMTREGIERPEEIEEMAREILASGLRFEAEVLTTGQVSFTVSDDEEGVDLFIEISQNGREVTDAVDRLVRTAYESLQGETDV